MAGAYILIEVSGGKTKSALKKLTAIKGLNISAVTGPYDAIAYIEGKDLNALGNTVLSKIHAVSGVTKTTTCMCVDVK